MAKRVIDWEAVEREYRMGQKSLRVLSSEFNVSIGAISKKASRSKWVQDKTEEVRKRTQAALLTETGNGNKEGNTPTAEDIERAVQSNIDVIRGHRKIIKRTFDFAERLLKQVEEADTLDPKIDNRVFLSIAQGLAKVIPLERQAFSIDKGGEDDGPGGKLVMTWFPPAPTTVTEWEKQIKQASGQ